MLDFVKNGVKIMEKEMYGIRYAEAGVDASKKKPLLIYLHGAGERGVDLDKVYVHGPLKEKDNIEIIKEFVLVAPQCGDGKTWWDYAERLYQWLSEYVKNEYVDETRVYLTGNSMGGYGTWALSMAHPELFAAIVPVCGGGLAWNAGMLENTPVWAFHCVGDDLVKCQETITMVDAVKRYSKSEVKITIYPEISHDAWTKTYQNTALYEWLLSKQKI